MGDPCILDEILTTIQKIALTRASEDILARGGSTADCLDGRIEGAMGHLLVGFWESQAACNFVRRVSVGSAERWIRHIIRARLVLPSKAIVVVDLSHQVSPARDYVDAEGPTLSQRARTFPQSYAQSLYQDLWQGLGQWGLPLSVLSGPGDPPVQGGLLHDDGFRARKGLPFMNGMEGVAPHSIPDAAPSLRRHFLRYWMRLGKLDPVSRYDVEHFVGFIDAASAAALGWVVDNSVMTHEEAEKERREFPLVVDALWSVLRDVLGLP